MGGDGRSWCGADVPEDAAENAADDAAEPDVAVPERAVRLAPEEATASSEDAPGLRDLMGDPQGLTKSNYVVSGRDSKCK